MPPHFNHWYKLCATVHQRLQSRAPQYMTECCIQLLSDITRRKHLRSASCHQLFVPRHRRSMLGRRAFSVAGSIELELVTGQCLWSNTFLRQFLLWNLFLLFSPLAYTAHCRLPIICYTNFRLTAIVIRLIRCTPSCSQQDLMPFCVRSNAHFVVTSHKPRHFRLI